MDDDMKYYNERLATLEVEEKKVIEHEKKLSENRLQIQARREEILDLIARKSERSVGSQDQIKPPDGECKRHTDWCFKTILANPGRLNRDQIIRYLKTRIKCNSKDPDQSVGDALSKLVRDRELRVSADGCYWAIENPSRRMPTKELHQSMFSADHTGLK